MSEVLSEEQLRDLYVLYISGAADWKRDGTEVSKNEMWYKKSEQYGGDVAIEFVDCGLKKAVARIYYSRCGEAYLDYEIDYENCKPVMEIGHSGSGGMRRRWKYVGGRTIWEGIEDWA